MLFYWVAQYFNLYNISKIDANVLIDHKLDLIAVFIDIYVIDKYNFVDFMQVVAKEGIKNITTQLSNFREWFFSTKS